jgi:serine/threonine protein kinase
MKPPPDPDQVFPALDAYLEALQAGRPPDKQDLVARHPELAGMLECLDTLEQLAPPAVQPTDQPSPANAPTLGQEVHPGVAPPAPTGGPAVGTDFGKYVLLAEIGRGGMGVVHRALQKDLGRPVALKMILAGAQAGAQDLARFRTEAEAVARLRHPNIVHIYEVGEHDGRPYFSLEFVDGGSLDAKLDGTPLPSRPAAQLVETLARAVHHAHEHGIVHRDLKPANILLQKMPTTKDTKEHQGKQGDPAPEPGRAANSASPLGPFVSFVSLVVDSWIPKITDFGLAKKLDQSLGQTQSGSILGTPSYMAPEQAEGKTHEIGPAADIYALGAILYELVTGRPPFKAATALDTLLLVASADPVSPRLLNPKVQRDLETICLKCLEKDPGRRYGSADQLAADLHRYGAGEPIHARPVSRAERLWRWCRRRPGWAALIAASLLFLAALIGGGIWFNRKLRAALGHTQQARHELQIALTKQVAERLDRDLRQLAMVPQMMAATLEQRSDWEPKQLEAWMRASLQKDQRIYGTCLAFEPGRFPLDAEDSALYVYRHHGRLETKLLRPDGPSAYPYRTMDWYTVPKRERRPLWSEPFVDKEGGNIPMVTYSVPFSWKGRTAGIVTVDLSIQYFSVLRQWLEELRLGRHSYAFVVSRAGKIISHPNPAYEVHRHMKDLDDLQPEEGLPALIKRIGRGETGSARGTDGPTGRPCTLLFAPVGSSGWSLVAVVPETASETLP